MRIIRQLDQIPDFKNAVITIGTFDGVHLGHAKIIEQMQAEAARVGGETVLVSFYPHPRRILQSEGTKLQILNTANEKARLLKEKGIQNLVIVPFNKTFACMEAKTYIEDFLVKYFHPHSIIIGYDHRFGFNREGDFQLLEAMADTYGYRVIEISKKLLQDAGISSTRIRKAIKEADIFLANELLGYAYFFSGEVIEGEKLGRKMGYPTANIQIDESEKLIPEFGVYAVEVDIEGFEQKFQGMLNIGNRPTVGGKQKTTEVHIFDFDEMIYGKQVTIHLKKHLRNEVKFAGIDKLKEQLAKDKADSLAYFSEKL